MAESEQVVDSRLTPVRRWLAAPDDGEPVMPPISFSVGDRQLAGILGEWSCETAVELVAADERSRTTVTYRDLQSGLVARCEVVEYADFPAIEWTPHFRNDGGSDSPILAEIQALDLTFERKGDPEFLLHHATGSPALASDYEPKETRLRPRSETRITTKGGRPSDTDLPYFNLEYDGGGVIVALGWPGQWGAQFSRDAEKSLRIRGGQEQTHFTLHPGEEVRGPLIALLGYEGDWIEGQNVWRRWMIAHNLPKIKGMPPAPFISAGSSNQTNEMDDANEENQNLFIDRYLEKNIPLDYYWMDAGWYVTASGHWYDTGTWEVDRKRFPSGLRAVTDHAHAKGLKCVVWFEPERLAPGSWLAENHPEWLITLPGYRWTLLDLGNPEAWRWVVERFDALIRSEGVDLYRQDFNVAPLDYWRSRDA
ncbi:MAG TPA: alpha-galactosidase, partial [Chloroflexota bacterium]|nr:alpha-galactosidase [Chloroflexota bacterium]